ncbi:MAG TPA: hypothetical protein VIG24_10465 [Acidimicrobiia bacterium]
MTPVIAAYKALRKVYDLHRSERWLLRRYRIEPTDVLPSGQPAPRVMWQRMVDVFRDPRQATSSPDDRGQIVITDSIVYTTVQLYAGEAGPDQRHPDVLFDVNNVTGQRDIAMVVSSALGWRDSLGFESKLSSAGFRGDPRWL